jgi:hypothetical protein
LPRLFGRLFGLFATIAAFSATRLAAFSGAQVFAILESMTLLIRNLERKGT